MEGVKFKRGANPGEGKDYEVTLLALFSLRLFLSSMNGECDHFDLGFNVDGYGKFDDFVIFSKKYNLKKTILIQVKTKQKKLHANAFSVSKGPFSVNEYAVSAKKLLDKHISCDAFILWTNAELWGCDDNLQAVEYFDNIVETSTSSTNHIFKYKLDDDTEFSDKFFIYTKQMNLPQLEKAIFQIFKNFCGNEESSNCFIKLCSALYNEKPIKDVVYREPRLDIQRTAIFLIVSLLKQFVVSVIPQCEDHKKQWSTFCKAAKEFTVSVIESAVVKKWTYLVEGYSIWSKAANDPIVLKINEDNSRQVIMALQLMVQIEFCKYVIILGKLDIFPENVRVFKNLSEVDGLSKNLLQEFDLSLNVCSRMLGITPDAVLEKITPSFLFDCLSDEELKKETLPEHHIPQTINTSIIYEISILHEKNDQMFFVILTNGYKVEDIKKEIERQTELKDRNIFSQLTNNECGASTNNNFTFENISDYSKILQKYQKHKNINIFQIISTENNSLKDAKLEWILSTGSTTSLPKPENKSVEVKLENFHNKINLICADPGLGKSTVLKELYNQVSPNCFAKFIRIHEHVRFLKKVNTETSCEEIIKTLVGNGLSDKKIIKNLCSYKKQLYLFFDGLDELDSQYLNSALLCIKKLQCLTCCHIWVSSRLHLNERLENEFEIWSMNIDNISKDQQKTYIKNRLSSDFNNIDLILTNIYSNFEVFVQNSDFFGIPLYLFVITEVLRESNKEDDISQLLILTKLYETFFQGKLNHLQSKNKQNYRTINNLYNLDQYEIVSLKVCLEKTDFESLNITKYEKSLSIVKNSLSAGIITDFSKDNIAVFAHYSFAEYFCARFLCQKFYKYQDQLTNIYFNPKYKSIRIFLNMKLSENSPLHLDVIYLKLDLNNLDPNDVKECKDDAGRNLIQTAISCGEYYPLLQLETLGKLINYYHIPDNVKINEKLVEIIKKLYEIYDLNEKDDMLAMSSIEYVQKMQDLSIFNIFIKSNNNRLEKHCLTYKNTILGYSVKRNLTNLIELPFYDLQLLNSVKFYYNLKYGKFQGNAIHVAAYEGNLNCLKTLIQNKADVNPKNNQNLTPLHFAALNGHLKCLQTLLQSGINIHSKAVNGYTSLHLAAQAGHLECLRVLIQCGADIHSKTKYGFTPLHLAAQSGHAKCIETLIQSGADNHSKSDIGHTSLDVATDYGHLECLKTLIRYEADIHSKTVGGATSLHIATKNGHLECLKTLIQCGADVNSKTNEGTTSLHLAAKNDHLECLQTLIQCGADVHSKTNIGFTSLHLATIKGHLECLKTLIQSGADVHSKVNYGFTPLHLAALKGHSDCLKVLLRNNADVNCKCDLGFTPLKLALQNKHFNCVLTLIQNRAD